jgi:hypothetical protein
VAHFRLEAILDNMTGLYLLEAYYPPEATEPFAGTEPWFRTEDEVYGHFKEKFSEVFPDKELATELKPN